MNQQPVNFQWPYRLYEAKPANIQMYATETEWNLFVKYYNKFPVKPRINPTESLVLPAELHSAWNKNHDLQLPFVEITRMVNEYKLKKGYRIVDKFGWNYNFDPTKRAMQYSGEALELYPQYAGMWTLALRTSSHVQTQDGTILNFQMLRCGACIKYGIILVDIEGRTWFYEYPNIQL